MFFFYLISGLFLGWSLGANDAANVFGTAVGTRMVKFSTAAILCSVFVLVGAVLGGAGASHTLGKLGAVNALPGSFSVALAAAVTVTWMTRLSLPVSTSQAVVGAIIGWNFFSGQLTDIGSLTRIVSSWILCPILAGTFALGMYSATRFLLRRAAIHMFHLDVLTRYGLLAVGAFASYSLGANNIANVMGVFVPAAPFDTLHLVGGLTLDPAQQLFLLGAVAIGVGVITYSKRVMLTVGNDLFRLSSIAALVVVLAQAVVLFLFSSQGLEAWLAQRGLPTIPLVPVSSSQAVIGAVIGIGLARGGRNIHFRVLGRIASGWVTTPLISGVVSFVLLFFVQNTFSQKVYVAHDFVLSPQLLVRLDRPANETRKLQPLVNRRFDTAVAMERALRHRLGDRPWFHATVEMARVRPTTVDIGLLEPKLDYRWFTREELSAVFALQGRSFRHGWQLRDALAKLSVRWRPRPGGAANRQHNKMLRDKLDRLVTLFERPRRSTGR